MKLWLRACINFVLNVILIKQIIAGSPLYQFIQLPNVLQIVSFSVEQTVNTSIVEGCVPIIKSTTVALYFNPTNQSCTSYSKIQGFNTVVSTNVYYLRMPGKCGACATSLQAKQAILSYTYQNNACPDSFFIYDPTTGYCVANATEQTATAGTAANPYFTNYGSYSQGAYRNKTIYVMSRGLAAQALTHTCPFSNSTTAMFNSIWYCYTRFITSAPSPTYVTQNVCGKWISGGAVIKFVHTAEPGYLSSRYGDLTYTGIVLPKGASGTSASYRYYDGTVVPYVYRTWHQNHPAGQTLVYIDLGLNLFDGDDIYMYQLICRSLAS